MVNRACILLFALCIQFVPSLQQLQKLGKRLDYMELMMNSVALKTQFDISELRDAIELINNKTEGESSAHVDVSPRDAAAIADLESEMKKAINQHDLTITAIAKAVSDEKKYTRQQMEALEIVADTIANQSIDEIKSDLMEMNSTLKEEVQEVKSDMMEMNSTLKEEVQEVKSDMMEMNSTLKEEVQEVKSDMMEMNSTLKEEVQEVKSDMMEMTNKVKEDVQEIKSELMETKEMNSKLKNELEENKEEILELRQMIMEMPWLKCPDGWVKFQDTCYLHVKTDEVSWDVAETRCAEQGGVLAEPDTEEKVRYVLKTFPGASGPTNWIGGTDRQSEGTWVWSSSNRNITFFLWGSKQPNSYGGNQDCLEIWAGYFNDEGCAKQHNYICEKKANIS